jgi:polyphosphate kinase 2 (PPK2 family)
MGIFNRSYSEKVLIARVHREFLARPRLSMGLAAGAGLWRERARFITEIQELKKIRAELAK